MTMTTGGGGPLKMVAASFYIPKHDPEHPRGQDAHFIAAKEQFIGVFDGVGGLLKYGIDSGVYANQLMRNSLKSLKQQPGKKKKLPKQVLEEAYSKSTERGSSTACIASFSGEEGGVLHAANVGDSGFLIIREGAILYRSKPQQHYFNCPYQLGTEGDHPSVAEEIKLCGAKKGDLMLLATDGVFDNVSESELLYFLYLLLPDNHHAHDHLDLEELCENIAKIALLNSRKRNTDSPFSKASRRAGQKHRGGKIDDITLVVARIE